MDATGNSDRTFWMQLGATDWVTYWRRAFARLEDWRHGDVFRKRRHGGPPMPGGVEGHTHTHLPPRYTFCDTFTTLDLARTEPQFGQCWVYCPSLWNRMPGHLLTSSGSFSRMAALRSWTSTGLNRQNLHYSDHERSGFVPQYFMVTKQLS